MQRSPSRVAELRAAGVVFAAEPTFETAIAPGLRAHPFHRRASADELVALAGAWGAGDPDGVIRAWRASAAPIRATPVGVATRVLAASGSAPQPVVGRTWLAVLRAVGGAAEAFRAGLPPERAEALRAEFPWFAGRLDHVPSGPTPTLRFPPAWGEFFARGTGDELRGRWQLIASLNELVQAHYTEHCAGSFGLPVLQHQARHERALARRALGAWMPRAEPALLAQALELIDGLHAHILDATLLKLGPGMIARASWDALRRTTEWDDYVTAVEALAPEEP
jgi:hypothetical protein